MKLHAPALYAATHVSVCNFDLFLAALIMMHHELSANVPGCFLCRDEIKAISFGVDPHA